MSRFFVFSLLIVAFGCSSHYEVKRMNWQELCKKWSDEGYNSLTEEEQIWLNTRGFIDAVNDGGLVSFFYNNWANYYDDTTFALGELEAFEALDILESFGEFFGDEVPADIDDRNDIINSWASDGPESKASETVDDLLRPLMSPLEDRLRAYLIENRFDPD